jgi:hypothetical protein
MAKSKNIGFRLGLSDFEQANEKALMLGHSSPHHFARSLLMREIHAQHCLSSLINRNHQSIVTSKEMLTDVAISLLAAFEVPPEKTDLVLSQLSKYL